MPLPDSAYARILATVASIPKGRVATYGEVAARAGLPGRARQVGFALRALGDGTVPWHRVVNAQGRVSLVGDGALRQRRRLAREGVRFDARGRIDLARFGMAADTDTRTEPRAARHRRTGA